MTEACPHGDPTCPCPDGLACHYEGLGAMPCPRQTLLLAGETKFTTGFDYRGPVRPAGSLHCHVEGCGWTGGSEELCGLRRIGAGGMPAHQAHDLGCGAVRRLVARRPDPARRTVGGDD